MAGILELAKEVRLSPVKCPHCGRNVRTGDLIRELFSRILDRAVGGEKVEVTGFGTFEIRTLAAGKVTSAVDKIGHGIIEYPEALVLRFRQSRILKAKLRKIKEKRS